MRAIASVVFALALQPSPAAAETPTLLAEASAVYRQAQEGRWYANAHKLNPRIMPTSDGKSFWVIWQPQTAAPSRWIVSLHGSQGFATDDLAIWHPHLKHRDVGVLSLQWWNATDDSTRAYMSPQAIYREIDIALQRMGIPSGTAMLHGFSRGAANSYAITALDRGRGRRYFAISVASSGGVGIDFPPNRDLTAGKFGNRPLSGSRWITVAGGRDSNGARDGIAGMRQAVEWLRAQGAEIVDSIEDTSAGHGALMTNPANAKRVLDYFLGSR